MTAIWGAAAGVAMRMVAAIRGLYFRELGRRVPLSASDPVGNENAADCALDGSSEVQKGDPCTTELSSEEAAEPGQVPNAETVMTDVVFPSLPREALKRIETAEREAKARYDEDKIPYFPKHPEFSFLEDSVFRSIQRILEYLRILAQDILDAHLKEYLEYSPADLFTNRGLLLALGRNVGTVVDQLWRGYGYTLQFEPSSRRARFDMAVAMGTINEHPELEPWRYPTKERWADFHRRMGEPGSEMSRFSAEYEATMMSVLQSQIKHYQQEAISRTPDLREKLQNETNHAHGLDAERQPREETLAWEDIEVRFLSDARIEILIAGNRRTLNYAEMGCEDKRSKTPNYVWQTLVLLAQKGGVIDGRAYRGRDRSKVQKRIQQTRRLLQTYFAISDDPIPFEEPTGYQARFKICWSRSADA